LKSLNNIYFVFANLAGFEKLSPLNINVIKVLILTMANIKKVGVILIGFFVALLLVSFFIGSAVNLLVPPSEAVPGDKIIEDIGGDNVLVATLKGCAEVERSDIPDGSFRTNSNNNLGWKNAKNVSYVDTYGKKGHMIVWKDSPQDYPDLESKDKIMYVSDYIDLMNGTCFVANFPDKNAVYGIILAGEIKYSESDLMYTILGLNSSEFTQTYSTASYDYSGGYSGGSSHYHTVVPDRYTLSRTDPGAYYDHYEYGDNYEIDNYLESEGYD
jgi:hypothetical protein